MNIVIHNVMQIDNRNFQPNFLLLAWNYFIINIKGIKIHLFGVDHLPQNFQIPQALRNRQNIIDVISEQAEKGNYIFLEVDYSMKPTDINIDKQIERIKDYNINEVVKRVSVNNRKNIIFQDIRRHYITEFFQNKIYDTRIPFSKLEENLKSYKNPGALNEFSVKSIIEILKKILNDIQVFITKNKKSLNEWTVLTKNYIIMILDFEEECIQIINILEKKHPEEISFFQRPDYKNILAFINQILIFWNDFVMLKKIVELQRGNEKGKEVYIMYGADHIEKINYYTNSNNIIEPKYDSSKNF